MSKSFQKYVLKPLEHVKVRGYSEFADEPFISKAESRKNKPRAPSPPPVKVPSYKDIERIRKEYERNSKAYTIDERRKYKKKAPRPPTFGRGLGKRKRRKVKKTKNKRKPSSSKMSWVSL